MYVLRTDSGRLGRGIRRQPHGGTRPPRRVCTRQLHVGTSELPREMVYRPEVLRRVQPRQGGESTTPHPAELARGLPMNESERRWAALRNIVQFADLLQRDVPGPGPLVA